MPACLNRSAQGMRRRPKPIMPSAYWGNEQLWDTRVNNQNSVFDKQGRLWLAAAVRGLEDEPAFCRRGSDHSSAKLRPLTRSGRQLAMFDPKTGEYTFIDTCFGTQHLNFALDANETLWTSGGAGDNPVGWLNTKISWRPATRRNHKDGHRSSSIPTATAGATNIRGARPAARSERTCA